MLHNLINLNVEYYTDDRDHIFMSAGQRTAVPNFFGYSPVAANLGKTHTQGYEIELKFQKTIGKANWWLNTAFTHAKDKVIYMEDAALLPAYQKNKDFQISQTRNTVNGGFLNNWDDVYSMTRYASNQAAYLPGDIRTVDFNGDGVIDSYDSAPWGYPTRPQNTYNYTLGVDIKGWSFMVQFYGVNNVTRNIGMAGNGNPFNDGGTYTKVYRPTTDEWTATNLDATWKAMRINNTTTDADLYLLDGSYFRLKTAEIAYTFTDKAFLRRIGLSSWRIYLNGNNLFVITKMWNDREDNAAPSGTNATSITAYPMVRLVNLGMTINF